MEDRYEIRGKIGQGGLGTVYRGYDVRMNREVAIKRIISNLDDESMQEEATKQLASEAGALASLQHPHIVTVFDVGSDEDGQYVVMELINGKTLDEIIENAPLTWPDFRELAMQSQEALIAAQELDMIHSDLKPPNIMLTWLPSGKFQVKIVDFGLAVLTQNQSQEEIDSMETVFGSIFFMPPEQFERETLDVRSDLYSMGCVYYQALTGTYPFNGDTGNEVMDAHLNHKVTPIQDLRADIPLWLCDWVMWHINRNRDDRPASAREALAVFLQNDKNLNPEMSRGSNAVKRPRLIIPGAVPSSPSAPSSAIAAETSAITGVPLMPPDPTTSVQLTADKAAEEEAKKSKTAPQPLAPPEGFKPSVHTSQLRAADSPSSDTSSTATAQQPTAQSATGPQATASAGTSPGGLQQTQGVYISTVTQATKRRMSNSAKVMIVVVLGILIAVSTWMLINRSEQNKQNERLNELMAEADSEGATEVKVSRSDLDLLLKSVAFTGVVEERDNIYTILIMAVPEDETNIDLVIVNYVTTQEILPDVRKKLIGEVLRKRADRDIVPLLLGYAAETSNIDAAVECYKAIHGLVDDSHVDDFVKVITSSSESVLRREAESNLTQIINTSDKRPFIAKQIIKTYSNARDANVKHAMIRLLGRCSTDNALDLISDALDSEDDNTRIAAAVALGDWKDERAVDILIDHLSRTSEIPLRKKPYDALLGLAGQPFIINKDYLGEKVWTKVRGEAKTSDEKWKLITELAKIDAKWPIPMIEAYTNDGSEKVSRRAKQALDHVKDREAVKQD